MTTCNYCMLQQLKRHAARQGEVITVDSANNVYRHPPGIDPSELAREGADRSDYWQAWFMALPDHCCC